QRSRRSLNVLWICNENRPGRSAGATPVDRVCRRHKQSGKPEGLRPAEKEAGFYVPPLFVVKNSLKDSGFTGRLPAAPHPCPFSPIFPSFRGLSAPPPGGATRPGGSGGGVAPRAGPQFRAEGLGDLPVMVGQGRLPARLLLAPALRVVRQARAGRDQPADDDVLLQAPELVPLAVDAGLGEHAGGLLERRRGDERLGGQRGLGDAEQHRPEPRPPP